MNRKMWETDFFSEERFTAWNCSKCFSGTLFVKLKPTVTSNDFYSAQLICSNSNCQEEYLSTGMVRYFSVLYGKEVSKYFVGKRIKHFYPHHFVPSLRLFQLNQSVPNEVASCIDKSFDIFWTDQLSSANAIRRSLEFLMDKLNVVNSSILHQRIENYKSTNIDIASMLLAIKWIGNSGSHGENLIKSDLLDAYEILEHCLNELFPAINKGHFIKMAEEINELKGRRSKKV